jgi:sugar/nucleoside kinase (ribokinase family)
MSKYDCLVIGDAMFDVIFNAEKQIQIISGGTGYCRNFYFSPGGAGNIAVALALLGEKTVFAGKVGNDLLGQMYIDDLEQNQVQPKIFIDENLAPLKTR